MKNGFVGFKSVYGNRTARKSGKVPVGHRLNGERGASSMGITQMTDALGLPG